MGANDTDNNVRTILEGIDMNSVESFAAFHLAVKMLLNHTQFEEELDINMILNETLMQTSDKNELLKALEHNHILYETYAFFELFFGEKGFFMKEEGGEEAQASEGAASSGFLQGESTEESASAGPAAESQDSRTIFKDIHDRIAIYACHVILELLGFMPAG